ncbi:MAG: enoyl-CoA hydratase/isomerase family protein, partial [Rubrobacter sp.]
MPDPTDTVDRLVLLERLDGGVATLTLNNPPLNLVTLEMARQLIEALHELAEDDSVRAVVVTGAGEKAFCAGSDVREFPDVRDKVVEKKLARENEAFGSLESMPKP